jgi:hypothetical protein
MNALKSLALAGVAVAGLGMFASTDAEARGFRGGGGGFHRGGGMHFGGGRHFGGRHLGFHRRHIHGHRHGFWRHGRWIGGGFGIAVVGDSCYRYRWLDTPYGPVRRLVNICTW